MVDNMVIKTSNSSALLLVQTNHVQTARESNINESQGAGYKSKFPNVGKGKRKR